MVLNIGRVCVKIAGRDAGKRCVIVKEIDANYVLVDGETRRRKVNKSHLEPLDLIVEISSGAENAAVVSAMKKAGFEVAEKKAPESKENTVRPKRQKAYKSAEKPVEKKAKAAKPKAEKAPAEKKAKPKKAAKSEEPAGDEE